MSKKGGRGGGHLQSKKFHCKFTQVNAYLRTFAKKKRNVISKKGRGGGQGRLGVFQKNIHFGDSSHPLIPFSGNFHYLATFEVDDLREPSLYQFGSIFRDSVGTAKAISENLSNLVRGGFHLKGLQSCEHGDGRT